MPSAKLKIYILNATVTRKKHKQKLKKEREKKRIVMNGGIVEINTDTGQGTSRRVLKTGHKKSTGFKKN